MAFEIVAEELWSLFSNSGIVFVRLLVGDVVLHLLAWVGHEEGSAETPFHCAGDVLADLAEAPDSSHAVCLLIHSSDPSVWALLQDRGRDFPVIQGDDTFGEVSWTMILGLVNQK